MVNSCQKHDSQVLGEVLNFAKPRPGTGRDWRRRLRPPPELRGGQAAPRHVDLAARQTRRASSRRGLDRARSRHQGWRGSSAVRLGKSPSVTTDAPSPKSAMHRLKAAFGPPLRSRLEHNQTHEALLRAHLLNRWPTHATVSVAWPLLSGMGFVLCNRSFDATILPLLAPQSGSYSSNVRATGRRRYAIDHSSDHIARTNAPCCPG